MKNRPQSTNRLVTPALAVAALAALSGSVQAQSTLTATTPSPIDYQLSTNWSAGVPNAIGASAIAGADLPAGTAIVNLNGAVTLGNLSLGDTNSGASNGFYNIASGTGGSLTFDNTTGNATLQRASATASTDNITTTVSLTDTLSADIRQGTIGITGVVSGAGGILRTDVAASTAVIGGTLQLTNNANSYSGTTVIEHGTLQGILTTNVIAGANSVFGNATSPIVIGTANTTSGSFLNSITVLSLTAGTGLDATNFTLSRDIDTSQAATNATAQTAGITFAGDGVGGVNTNTLTMSGTIATGARLVTLTPQRAGQTINVTGNITSVAATTGAVRVGGFAADPNVDGHGTGTVRLSNLARTYAGQTQIITGTLIADGVIPLTGASPVGTGVVEMSQGTGGNIVGAGNFAGTVAASRDTSPDINRNFFLESAGSSYARTLNPGNGSGSTPATGGYTGTINVINGFQIGGLNTTGLTTFGGNITPGNPTVGVSATNQITVAANIALESGGAGGTTLFSGAIVDGTTTVGTVTRVTVNGFRNHPNLDGVNNVSGNTGPDGIADIAFPGALGANAIIPATVKQGTVVLGGTNTWDGTTEVLGGRLLVSGSIAGDTLTVASGSTLGGSGTINAGIAASTVQVSGAIAPGGRVTDTTISSLGAVLADTGTLTSGKQVNFLTGSALTLEANGTTAGATVAGYDQLAAAGITITGTTTFSLTLGYAPTAGNVLTVISNTGAGAIAGTFSNLANASTFTTNFGAVPFNFTVNYAGGDGNDLTLIAQVPEPSTYALMIGGAGMLFLVQRRRRQA